MSTPLNIISVIRKERERWQRVVDEGQEMVGAGEALAVVTIGGMAEQVEAAAAEMTGKWMDGQIAVVDKTAAAERMAVLE